MEEKCKTAENKIRDLINWVAVMKEEEVEDVSTQISPEAAKVLTEKLEELAESVGKACVCEEDEFESESDEDFDEFDEDSEDECSECDSCKGCH